jgi:hypothetical protein
MRHVSTLTGEALPFTSRADLAAGREVDAEPVAALLHGQIDLAITSSPVRDHLVDFVRGGFGIGLVSRWSVAPALARGDLVARRFTKAGLPERWAVVHRRDAATRFPFLRIAEILKAGFAGAGKG